PAVAVLAIAVVALLVVTGQHEAITAGGRAASPRGIHRLADAPGRTTVAEIVVVAIVAALRSLAHAVAAHGLAAGFAFRTNPAVLGDAHPGAAIAVGDVTIVAILAPSQQAVAAHGFATDAGSRA